MISKLDVKERYELDNDNELKKYESFRILKWQIIINIIYIYLISATNLI